MKSASGYIGAYSASESKVTVVGKRSSWTNSEILSIGHYGNGVLLIEAGGSVSNSYGYIGDDYGSEGSVTVTGVGSNWTNTEDLHVGGYNNGTIRVDGGGLSAAILDI